MIAYHHQGDFRLRNQKEYTDWINNVVSLNDAEVGELNYIFCTDTQLLELNKKHLGKDYYTDIITFEYEALPRISGDIYISADRVRENAEAYAVSFEDEMRRVMIHGVLHLLGYKDKEASEVRQMREKEEELMALFHVKQS